MDGVDVVVAACFRVVGYFTLYDTCLLILKISSSRPDDMYSTLIFYFYFLLRDACLLFYPAGSIYKEYDSGIINYDKHVWNMIRLAIIDIVNIHVRIRDIV